MAKFLFDPEKAKQAPPALFFPTMKAVGVCACCPLPPVKEPRSSKAEPAEPHALAAAASLLADRIRLLSLSKPPDCSAAAPSHPAFRCHYLNMLLIRPQSTEVCSLWSSARSTGDFYFTVFPGGHDTTHGLEAPAGSRLLSAELSLYM